MSYRGWQSWARRFRQEWSTAEEGVSDAAADRSGGGVSRRLFWMALLMGLLLAGAVGWGLLLLNREAVRLSHPAAGNTEGAGIQTLSRAWVVPSEAERFPEGAPGRWLALPDEWALNHPGYKGGIWYRFQIDEAIAYVNQRPRPLALYYFGYERDEQRLVLDNTHSGGACLNDTLLHVAQDDLPFGGVGPSGMGHYHGYEGFQTFSQAKGVLAKQRLNLARLVYPPYGKRLQQLVYRFFIR